MINPQNKQHLGDTT